MKTGGRRAPDVREGGGDGDGYGRVAVVASGGQRRREAATKGDVDDAWAAANDGNNGSNCGDGDSGRQRAAPAMQWGDLLGDCAAVGGHDDEALRKPTEV